ncbi:retrotransposon protein, putative, ty1-copia subclass [Tanacetum coccineum]|uniref:Retrotransposon protein, putative, ty1-copia subclass n=1 Tax=Tanacetum coccineum TaxID=301880 RepID=A0ABQ5H894_9ASTR
MYVIEQPIPPAPTANSGKPVAKYVLKMKGYVEQLERLDYVLPQDLSVGLILNGLTSDFAGFVRNYNMHNMGKTIGELHALLIEYEKGLPKKAETPQVMAIRSRTVGSWKRNCPVYLPDLLKKKKQIGIASSSDYGISVSKNDVLYFNVVPRDGYPKETISYYFYFPPEHKIVVARYVEFFKKSLITLEVSGRAIDLEEIQDEDTSPSEITSEIPMDVEGFEPPQEEVILIRRLCNPWKDNQVWRLVDLPPNCKTIRSKCFFKKKTDIDGIVHTYKARLVAKGHTQLYRVDYEETFSPVAHIRAIRILIAIAAFYDYEILVLWMSNLLLINGVSDLKHLYGTT